MIADPREFWPTETGHLHPWLAANVVLLGECLSLLGLRIAGREVQIGWQTLQDDILGRQQWTGGLRVDLTARDAADRLIVIEAQFDEGDHKHFGQLLTYAHAAEADAAVWVVAGDDPVFYGEHLELLAEMNQLYAGRRVFHVVTLTVESQEPGPPSDMTVYPTLRHIDVFTGAADRQVTAASPFTASRAVWF